MQLADLLVAVTGVGPGTSLVDKVKQTLLGANSPLGGTPQDRYQEVFNGGLRIRTTLDPRMQQLAQDKVKQMLPDTGGRFTAALVSMDPETGHVDAMVGGRDFETSRFNRAAAVAYRDPSVKTTLPRTP